MNIGWVGLGKLGLPCALVLGTRHRVTGYDINPNVRKYVNGDRSALAWVEPGVNELLDESNLTIVDNVNTIVSHAEIVFVAVQTPHAPEYGGEVPAPHDSRDFEYRHLVQAIRDIAEAAANQMRVITIVIISTVLPGTINKHITRYNNYYTDIVYSPQFIAMGTTIRDFKNPEFALIGSNTANMTPAADVYHVLQSVYDHPNNVQPFMTSIVNAELIKVAYNTFISMKIVWGNYLAQICDSIGADADAVVGALSLATERIISTKYMYGGMGDGGSCHPRDLIAMAHLEQQCKIPGEFYDYLARMREMQTIWLAHRVIHWHELTGLNVVVLGETYKPNVSLTNGSPSLLLRYYLENDHDLKIDVYDPKLHHESNTAVFNGPHVYIIATAHDEFKSANYPVGSVVIDPWGIIKDKVGVTIDRIGRM